MRVSDTLVIEGDRSILSRDIIQKLAQEQGAIEQIEYSNKEFFQKEKNNKDKFFEELRIIEEAQADLLRTIWLQILKDAENEEAEVREKDEAEVIAMEKTGTESENKIKEEEKPKDPLEALLNEQKALKEELVTKKSELDKLWNETKNDADDWLRKFFNDSYVSEQTKSLEATMKLSQEATKGKSPEAIKELEDKLNSYIANKLPNDVKELNAQMPSLLERTTVPDMIAKQRGAYDAVYQAAFSEIAEKPASDNKEESKGIIPDAPKLTDAARIAGCKAVNEVAQARQDLMAEIRAVGAAREKFGKNVALKSALDYAKGVPIKEYGKHFTKSEISAKSEEVIGVQYKLKENAERIAVLMDSKKPKLQNVTEEETKHESKHETKHETQPKVQSTSKPSNEPSLWSRIRNAVKDLAETIKSIGKKEPEKEAKATGPTKTMGH